MTATAPDALLEAELARCAGSDADASRHLIVQGDCLESAAFFAARKLPVRLIVTSPPYNANMPYAPGFDDKLPGAHYVAFLRRFARVADSVLAAGGHLVVN